MISTPSQHCYLTVIFFPGYFRSFGQTFCIYFNSIVAQLVNKRCHIVLFVLQVTLILCQRTINPRCDVTAHCVYVFWAVSSCWMMAWSAMNLAEAHQVHKYEKLCKSHNLFLVISQYQGSLMDLSTSILIKSCARTEKSFKSSHTRSRQTLFERRVGRYEVSVKIFKGPVTSSNPVWLDEWQN